MIHLLRAVVHKGFTQELRDHFFAHEYWQISIYTIMFFSNSKST